MPTPSSRSRPPGIGDDLARRPGREASRACSAADRIEGGVELHVKGAERVLAKIVTVAEGAGSPLLDVSLAEPTLENVFINLTGKDSRD